MITLASKKYQKKIWLCAKNENKEETLLLQIVHHTLTPWTQVANLNHKQLMYQ